MCSQRETNSAELPEISAEEREQRARAGDLACWLELVEDYAIIEERSAVALLALMVRRVVAHAPRDLAAQAREVSELVATLAERRRSLLAVVGSDAEASDAVRESRAVAALVDSGRTVVKVLCRRG